MTTGQLIFILFVGFVSLPVSAHIIWVETKSYILPLLSLPITVLVMVGLIYVFSIFS